MYHATIGLIVMLLLRLLIASLAAEAQESKVGRIYRVGFLAMVPPAASGPFLAVFRQALHEHGYVDGQNVTIEQRWTESSTAQLPDLAAELVGSKVDLILAWGTPTVAAAKQATKTIPIVMVGVGDPVGSGFVASLSHPGGNITGATNIARDLSAKLLESLKEAVPGASKVAVLRNVENPVSEVFLRETDTAARILGVELQVVGVRTPEDLDSAFAAMTREGAVAVIVLADPLFISQRGRIAQLALRHRLPSAFARRENADAGGLLAYGPSLSGQVRRAASFVDKIFRGAKPADLPVEQPMKLELVINLKTAKELGLTIPPTLLILADEVIQ